MKSIALSFTAALVAFAAFAAAAAPAQAGLDFTDTAVFQAGSPGVTFNGSSVLGSTATMNNGFGGAAAVTLSSDGTFITPNGTIDFQYTNGFGNLIFGAGYDTNHGFLPQYTMMIELGTVTGTVVLSNIVFIENGSSLVNPYALNQVLTSANSNSRVSVLIPSTGVGSIPLTERDLVQAVRLEFSFPTGSTNAIQIAAVVNPEPGTVALFGLGLAGLVGAVQARRKARARAQAAK